MGDSRDIKVAGKVNVKGVQADTEWMWARQINRNTAKLRNIPFFVKGMTLGDIVEFNPQTMRIVRVVEKCGRTLHGYFEFVESEVETLARWEQIKEYLSGHSIEVEGIGGGYFSLAVPLDTTDDDMRSLIIGCPIPVTLYFD